MRIHQVLGLAVLVALVMSAGPAEADEGLPRAGEAKARLEEAYDLGADDAIVEAIQYAEGVPDPEVIKLVARGLRIENMAVIEATLLALGATRHPAALKELHDVYRRVRKRNLDGYEHLFALLLKEMGRHGDPSSVEWLSDSLFNNLTFEVLTARFMGLGNIRTPEAVEALVMASRKAGGRGATGAAPRWRGRVGELFRVAMATLTGHDEGLVTADWDRWWRDHRKGLVIDPVRPPVPETVSSAFESYWGVPYYEPGDEPAPPTLRPPFEVIADPTKDQVAAAVEDLRLAFNSKDEARIVAAVQANAPILDKRVVHEIARGARSRSHYVRLISIQTLGWTKYKAALKQLHRILRREKKLHKTDEVVFAELLKAIGRHGDPSSVAVLTKSPFKGLTLASGRARILGLANIRTNESLEELVKGTQLAGGSVPRSWRPMGQKRFTREFLLALRILTGLEMPGNLEMWRQWYRKNKKSFDVSAVRPAISPEEQTWWEDYWNEPY